MELQNIRENRQAAQQRRIELTTLEQEINNDGESWLERINIHLERLLEKSDKKRTILRRMVYHYRARNMSSKARIRSLKEKLRKATKRQKRKKEKDRLRILAEASVAQHGTSLRTSSPNFKKFGAILVTRQIFGWIGSSKL